MTDERMALLELIEKGADADLVRELLAYASQRPRAAEVDRLTGAVGPGHGAGARRRGTAPGPDRINHRNGYRERSGAPDRARYPEAAQELVLPGLPRAAPNRREGSDRGHPSRAGLSIPARRDDGQQAIAGKPTCMAARPARSTTWSRRWAAPASRRARSRARARASTSASGPSSRGRSREAGPISGSTRPTYLESRHGGRTAGVAVIVATGVNTDGRTDARRAVPGVATGASEAEVFRVEFLRALADRGRRGVKLVIADDHKGLRAAAKRVFGAGLPRCRVHWARNLLARAAPSSAPRWPP